MSWMSKSLELCLVLFCWLQMSHPVLSITNATEEEKLPSYCAYCSCNYSIDGIVAHCVRKGLLFPPTKLDKRTTELYLQQNMIRDVRYKYLQRLFNLRILDLSENKITSIEIGAFRDLTNLTVLLLNQQSMSSKTNFVLQEFLRPGVFVGLQNLKVLHVEGMVNIYDYGVSRIPAAAMTDLTSLEELYIDGVRNVEFNESFEVLKNLTVVKMSGVSGECNIRSLDRKSFVGLPNLKNLTLEKCNIRELNQGIFWWTNKLNYLDMSWNTDLEIETFGKVIEELKFTDLEILKINAIHNENRAGTEILRSSVKYLDELKLKEVFLNNNGIEYIDYGVFDKFPSTLKRLYMRQNRLVFNGLYVYEAVFNNPNLEIFDAGDQNVVLRSDRAFTDRFQRAFDIGLGDRKVRSLSRRPREAIPDNSRSLKTSNLYNKNTANDIQSSMETEHPAHFAVIDLQVLICSGSMSDLRPLDFTNTSNNVSYVDLSRNFLPLLHANAFKGLYRLRFLNLSNNYIENVNHMAFHGLQSLKILDLENNLLGNALEEDRMGLLLSSLTNVTELTLSRNRIRRLSENVFMHLYHLERLNLSENYIEDVGLGLNYLNNLAVLDLSNNRLQTIPGELRDHLDKLAIDHKVYVNISDNKLICNCDNIPFLKWLFTSNILFHDLNKYYCSLQDHSVKLFNESRIEFLHQLEEDCVSYFEVAVSCSTAGSFALAVLASYLVYRNRWRLRYVYYMAKVSVEHKADQQEDIRYPFDVFVSYGDGDREFVVKEMVEHLESTEDIRLNIRDRDFEIGEVIAVNISKAIRISRKTFLLISRHFLKNKWCNFEMNMARMESVYTKRGLIVIVFLEDVPHKVLPLELIDLLRDCPSLDLPTDNELKAAFWHRCIDFINKR